MFTLPPDMQRYCLSYLHFRDLQALEKTSRGFKRMVSQPLNKIKIDLVLANPCRYHRIPEGDLKKLCWSAIVEQEKLLTPYVKLHHFEYCCPGLVKHDNLHLIVLAGKIYFLVTCNLFAFTFQGLNYKIEFKNDQLTISDNMTKANTFETLQTSQQYNGINCDGLPVGSHTNSDNWRTEFSYLGKSLHDKHYYLKILDGEKKRIFLIQTNERTVIQHVFTTVYEMNQTFHLAPYCNVFNGQVYGIEMKQIGHEKPSSCLILKHGELFYWVFVKENRAHFRTYNEVKAILSRNPS